MQAFRGSVENYNAAVDAWTNVGRTYRAALVQSIGQTPQAGWRFLSEFTANNPLIGDQSQPAIGGRLVEAYNGTLNASIFKFTDELSFGTPAAGPSAPGVLVYEDTGDPATSPLWTYDDNSQSFPLAIRGGTTTWGSAGPNNEILRLVPQVAGTAVLAGALRDVIELGDAWNPAGPYTFKLRLALSTGTITPNPDWEFLQDLTDAGVAWANTPGGDVSIPGSDRVASAWNLVGTLNRFQFAVSPASQFQWSSVPLGQSIGAVVLYRDTGNDATSRVWHWDANFTPFATNGGNITYGSGAQQVIQYGQH